MIADARAVNRKIRGKRARLQEPSHGTDTPAGDSATPSDPAPSSRRISVSQRSFDSMAQHFRRLVDIAASNPSFAPTETEYTIPNLRAYALGLVSLNKEVDECVSILFAARFERNRLIYDKDDGIYKRSIGIKNYIRTLLGHTDERFRMISSIKFKNKKA